LGVVYAIGIAILAGFSKFVPYVGSFITWTSLALVAYFQPFTPFGLKPLTYMIIVVGLAIMIDQTYDNFVTPRIIAKALRVHPAAVLVAAIIAANYLGILGVVVAAPMLATAALLWRYTLSKLLDLDPWPEPESEPPSSLLARLLGQIRHVWDSLRKRNVKAQ
jgi:predicted PurR-regulated permease PerM